MGLRVFLLCCVNVSTTTHPCEYGGETFDGGKNFWTDWAQKVMHTGPDTLQRELVVGIYGVAKTEDYGDAPCSDGFMVSSMSLSVKTILQLSLFKICARDSLCSSPLSCRVAVRWVLRNVGAGIWVGRHFRCLP
jgi:hypothetical protein